ncbi:MAG: hypothetical protein IPN94_08860 [Sphingobacteriales bacterium]|nr:hypothetical protein [Sphingobacteriales bacterium]
MCRAIVFVDYQWRLEYCGAVIKNATEQLTWNGNADDLKIIFIAGNEAFDQGPIDYRQSCKNAISKSILINTIFCGNTNEGINTHWKDGADLADGKYMNINSDATVVHIDAPQDSVINRLNLKLNDTYIGYGNYGKSQRDAKYPRLLMRLLMVLPMRHNVP